jgi:hypothetical protein
MGEVGVMDSARVLVDAARQQPVGVDEKHSDSPAHPLPGSLLGVVGAEPPRPRSPVRVDQARQSNKILRLDGAPRTVAQFVVAQRPRGQLKTFTNQERVLADAAKQLMMLGQRRQKSTVRIDSRESTIDRPAARKNRSVFRSTSSFFDP